MCSAQEPAVLPELRVLADRETGADPGPAIASWDHAQIRESAPRTIDELLASEPSFSLYRRQSAVFGNPTSAGVSLRNTGATAASRTLVLLDGIPQNDPFGGWVYWARYDAATLDSLRIIPSARAAAWGNQSPAGVIQMTRNPPFERRGTLTLGGGSQGTIGGSVFHQTTSDDMAHSVSVSAFGLDSAGFYALPASQRGEIDRKLNTAVAGGGLGWTWLAAPDLTVESGVSLYSEERGNGTALSRNSTDALDFSLRVSSTGGSTSWQGTAWHQRREFESVFSSASDDRSTETIALNQFDVPGRGTGASLTFRHEANDQLRFSGGMDGRWVTGETNEDAGTFRRREAGGEQGFVGAFGAVEFQADSDTILHAAARLDTWWTSDGRRIETSLADGSPLRSEFPEDRSGFEPSGSIEWLRTLPQDVELRIAAGTGFRFPTLNELHRPFRVRNDIVEANPDLDPERFVSLETGLTWQPGDHFTVGAGFFHHWIRDAIANVPVTDPAEISEIFGTLPPDGTGSMRRNVDEARVAGIEGNLEWRPRQDLELGLTGLWTDTRFVESGTQPLLEGKPFPQAPELRIVASGEWQATESLAMFATCEYGSAQYDDALATRRIPDYTSVGVGMSWRHGRSLYQARVTNIFDEEIQTGLGSDGLRTLAAPRSLWLSASWEF